ncbi:hypothetical protein [uncultured Nitrospira sp.]|uniref:hypothetical protein n=1 Tax=uncultured Nitrospira sp. TaxID=157176 RepID=UPI0031408973
MSALPGSTDEKWVIYWEREYSTAFAPERLTLDFHPHRPLMTNMPLSEQREVAASGYKVIPDDCGPVRFVGQYGWLIRSPADCRIRKKGSGFEWQSPPIRPEEQLLGYKSFSGMYVDTILNSGFPKLYCGIRFYYPMQLGMMMKDLPNHFYYFPKRTFSIWEGIATQEYKVTPNDFLPGYAAFVTNFLLQLDASTEEPTTILRGDPIGLVIPVLLPKHFTLQELKRTPEEASNP